MEDLRFDNFESVSCSKSDMWVLLLYDVERFILFKISDEHNVANGYLPIACFTTALICILRSQCAKNTQRTHYSALFIILKISLVLILTC